MRLANALFAALALLVAAADGSAGQVQSIEIAQFRLSAETRPPTDEAGWERVALPDHPGSRLPGNRGIAWYRFSFDLGQPGDEPLLLYVRRLVQGGRIWVNGEPLAEVQESSDERRVLWLRPFAFPIPPALLRVGTNTVHVRVDARSDEVTIGMAYVGPDAQVRPRFDARFFWTHTSAHVSIVVTTVTALFVVGIWLRRRLGIEYGLFGLAALFWGIRTLDYVVAIYPADLWLATRVVHYGATGGFAITMTLFMLRFAGIRRPRLERALIAYWPIGPLLLALGGAAWEEGVERYYLAGLVVPAALTFVAAIYAGWRQRTVGALAVCVGILIGLALAVRDYLLSQGLIDYDRPYLLHLPAEVLLVTIGILLADRFVHSLNESENTGDLLEAKVREKEVELAANYERLRDFERERAVADERQRIMQDMHDGLGSQLLTSLAMVERGALDREGMAQVLREAIDDMRLAIDTLSPGREGVMEALGNLHYRLEPRFRSAGVELRFHLADAPDRVDLEPDVALQVLRILQEALTNTLRHARAAHVDVTAARAESPPRLVLSVVDDGIGCDPGAKSSGSRGLSGMRRRADSIGAVLEIQAGPTGTRVTLACPLHAS